ncbi:MAG: homoserine kinase [Bdellovibrio sp.]|nr:homoserine kinase [Methylotenera sp.]
MSVFTTLTLDEARTWLRDFAIGEVVELRGIAAGITNTNYFVITQNARYVLTIFEKNNLEELPYFVDLMRHLAAHGVPCPAPIADVSGVALHALKGKPALMVSCLQGKDVATPNLAQVVEVALTLAKLHVAGDSFKQVSHNQRGQDWFVQTAQKVLPRLNLHDQMLLQNELSFQQALDTSGLPHGVIHGDLFRDNVLFYNDILGGFIDFYYACNDVLAYDVAIAVNEWCLHHNGADLGNIDVEKVDAFLSAYQSVRPLSMAEKNLWNSLLRRATLRFWLSRLHDLYFPIEGEITHAKDPNHFKSILKARIALEH